MSLKSKKKRYAVIFVVVLVILSMSVTKYTLGRMSRPAPITKDNIPAIFLVIGISADKQYSLLALHEYSNLIQKSESFYKNTMKKHYRMGDSTDIEVLWNEDLSKYRYYIVQKDLQQVTEDINKKIKNKWEHIKVRILNDDRIHKKQTIFLKKMNDDFTYYFVYEATDNNVIPLRYGDLTKSDGWLALRNGFFTFITGLIALKIFLVLYKRRFPEKQE